MKKKEIPIKVLAGQKNPNKDKKKFLKCVLVMYAA